MFRSVEGMPQSLYHSIDIEQRLFMRCRYTGTKKPPGNPGGYCSVSDLQLLFLGVAAGSLFDQGICGIDKVIQIIMPAIAVEIPLRVGEKSGKFGFCG